MFAKNNKERHCYREASSNDFIIRFAKEIQFDIHRYPKLRNSGMWTPYAGNCYRGFSSLDEEALYQLFCSELGIERSKMKVIYTTFLGAPSAKED